MVNPARVMIQRVGDGYLGVNRRPTRFAEELLHPHVCCLCHVIPNTTVLLPCSHALCESCLAGSLRLKGRGACPLDGESFIQDECQNVQLPVKKAHNLKAHCWNHKHGCKFVGKLPHLLKHYEQYCSYHHVTCPGCGDSVHQKDLPRHYRAGCNRHAAVSAATMKLLEQGDAAHFEPLAKDPFGGQLLALQCQMRELMKTAQNLGMQLQEVSCALRVNNLKMRDDLATTEEQMSVPGQFDEATSMEEISVLDQVDVATSMLKISVPQQSDEMASMEEISVPGQCDEPEKRELSSPQPPDTSVNVSTAAAEVAMPADECDEGPMKGISIPVQDDKPMEQEVTYSPQPLDTSVNESAAAAEVLMPADEGDEEPSMKEMSVPGQDDKPMEQEVTNSYQPLDTSVNESAAAAEVLMPADEGDEGPSMKEMSVPGQDKSIEHEVSSSPQPPDASAKEDGATTEATTPTEAGSPKETITLEEETVTPGGIETSDVLEETWEAGSLEEAATLKQEMETQGGFKTSEDMKSLEETRTPEDVRNYGDIHTLPETDAPEDSADSCGTKTKANTEDPDDTGTVSETGTPGQKENSKEALVDVTHMPWNMEKKHILRKLEVLASETVRYMEDLRSGIPRPASSVACCCELIPFGFNKTIDDRLGPVPRKWPSAAQTYRFRFRGTDQLFKPGQFDLNVIAAGTRWHRREVYFTLVLGTLASEGTLEVLIKWGDTVGGVSPPEISLVVLLHPCSDQNHCLEKKSASPLEPFLPGEWMRFSGPLSEFKSCGEFFQDGVLNLEVAVWN